MKHLDTIKNQTILIQTTYHPTPHLETELEIMERLLSQGNIIYWIICQGDFQVCFNNPKHKEMDCKVCYSRVNKGLQVLKKKVENHKNLHILKYSQFLKISDFKRDGFPKEFNFSELKELKSYRFKTYDSGMATASSLVSFTRNHEPDLLEHKDFIYRGLFTGAFLYDVFQLIIDKIKPDLAILFNGRFIENRPLLRICQEQKIAYATHERGGKINNFLFRINSTPHSIETISAEIEYLWENANKENRNEIGKTFFSNRIKRVEDAWYSFTKEQQEGRLPESFKNNEGKKVITIFNSSLDEYEGLDGFGPYFYSNDNEGIKRICEDVAAYSNIKLYLRVHPNLKGLDNSQNRFLNEEVAVLDSVEVIGAEDSVDTYALINKSDIIIVFGSTVGAEAAFAGKNVVLLGSAAYEDLDCVVIPKNHEEVMTILTDESYIFPNINPEEPLKYGYWNEKFGIDYQFYKPINLAKGTYHEMFIKASPIVRELRRIIQKLNGTYKK
jgi:hypothetical protein